MVANINYGTGISSEADLRLCGDISDGKRAVELGVSDWFNALAFAHAGAKAIAVDPDADKIAEMRSKADTAEVSVQCMNADLADLGDITSGTCDLVLAAHTIADVDDLSRLLRQVHRILIPSMPFVIALAHPFARVTDALPYGLGDRSIGDWFTTLSRSNFRVDQLKELGVGTNGPTPSTLILRARKEGS